MGYTPPPSCIHFLLHHPQVTYVPVACSLAHCTLPTHHQLTYSLFLRTHPLAHCTLITHHLLTHLRTHPFAHCTLTTQSPPRSLACFLHSYSLMHSLTHSFYHARFMATCRVVHGTRRHHYTELATHNCIKRHSKHTLHHTECLHSTRQLPPPPSARECTAHLYSTSQLHVTA